MMKIFNTKFEVSMRILLLLNTYLESLNADTIQAIDTISVYGKSYGISDVNLHGDNPFASSEITSRHKSINESLKELVKDNFLSVKFTDKGFMYSINENGKNLCNSMISDYSNEYSIAVNKTKNYFSKHPKKKMRQFAFDKLKGGTLNG